MFIILRNFSVVHIEDKIKFLPIYQNRRKEELVIRMKVSYTAVTKGLFKKSIF